MGAFGPFFADGHNNDASIIKHVINNNEQNIKEWLHADAIVIVDPGFRDAVYVMEELELQVKIPAFLKGKKNNSQLRRQIVHVALQKIVGLLRVVYFRTFFLYTTRKLFSKREYQKMESFQLSS